MKPIPALPRGPASAHARGCIDWHQDRIFDLEALRFPLLPHEIPRVKPGLRSTTRLEVFARACGYRTAAALQAEARTDTCSNTNPNPFEHAEWIAHAIAAEVGDDCSHWRAVRVLIEIVRARGHARPPWLAPPGEA